MIYTKAKLELGNNVNLELKVDIYSDELYYTCPICKKEVHMDNDFISSLSSASEVLELLQSNIFCCEECAKEYVNKRNEEGLNE